MTDRRPACLALIFILLGGCQQTEDKHLDHYSGDPQRGRHLVDEYGCGACHRIPRVAGARGQVGPPLEHMARRGYIAGVLPNTEQAMLTWLQSPQQVAPGTAMPDLGLTQAQARDIAAFLQQLD
nr:c-type cytochrome [uncultured Pseudomonas sp.]